MFVSLVLNSLIAYAWHKKFYRKLGLGSYKAIQRIHLNETPRLGGFIFILTLICYVIFSKPSESIFLLKLMLLSLIPILIIGLKEDLFQNVYPITRLLAIILTASFFLKNFNGPLPDLNEISILSNLFFFQEGIFVFFILSMTAIANGMNLVDGVNGLCASIAIVILSGFLFLSYQTTDNAMLLLILSILLLFIPYILLNYPNGYIFLGDLGAYSLGIILSMIAIIFFGRHPEISVWSGVLIFIYPATEITFSIFRRLSAGTSIFQADTKHLHLCIFNFFRVKSGNKKIANSLVTPVLALLWLFPLLSLTWTYHRSIYSCISIVIFIMVYCIVYTLFSKYTKK
jgi:UDP-N-acetylmuramyl pentapeptide phosphotransferase/UDP-N-acetylglucosamine-1-phosphate transferase